VIATHTKIPLKGLKMDTTLKPYTDEFFAKRKTGGKKEPKNKGFLTRKRVAKRARLTKDDKSAQKIVDARILPEIKKVPELKQYLAAKFSLSNGQVPHRMKF